MSLGCGSCGTCCGACQAKLAPPQNLDGWLGNLIIVGTSVLYPPAAPAVAATVAAVDGSHVLKKKPKQIEVSGPLAISSQSNLLTSPAALAGIGAVVLALILRK